HLSSGDPARAYAGAGGLANTGSHRILQPGHALFELAKVGSILARARISGRRGYCPFVHRLFQKLTIVCKLLNYSQRIVNHADRYLIVRMETLIQKTVSCLARQTLSVGRKMVEDHCDNPHLSQRLRSLRRGWGLSSSRGPLRAAT